VVDTPYGLHKQDANLSLSLELCLLTPGKVATIGRHISNSSLPPNWLTNTLGARAVPRRFPFMSEHSRCTDRTGTSCSTPASSVSPAAVG
jgi:hypothetical protein